MSNYDQEHEKPFDYFELAVAFLLGLAAIGAAWSSYQSSLWGGKSIEFYGQAATMSTKASTEHDRAEMDMAHDFECDMQAKERILAAIDSPNEIERTPTAARSQLSLRGRDGPDWIHADGATARVSHCRRCYET